MGFDLREERRKQNKKFKSIKRQSKRAHILNRRKFGKLRCKNL